LYIVTLLDGKLKKKCT